MILAFLCLVTAVHDGDTLTCADRTKVRIAGVNAREITGPPCPGERPCPAMDARAAREALVRLTLGKTLRCEQVGVSYRRSVAWCVLPDRRALSCALIRAGAAAPWDSYWRRYRLPSCRE